MNWIDRIYKIVTNKIFYHTAFWLSLFGVLYAIEDRSQGWLVVVDVLINIVFYAIIIYIILKYLIPSYLKTKRYLTYIGSLLLIVAIVTPLQLMSSYLFYFDVPEIKDDILRNLNFPFLQSFFVVGTGTVLKIITDWLRQNQQTQELEKKNIQSELQFLKSQVNPHFLFNTLNNLYALTLKKSDKAPEIVLKLSEMMRYMLYECNEKRVSLRKEINYLNNYLELEMLRQPKDIDVQLNVK